MGSLLALVLAGTPAFSPAAEYSAGVCAMTYFTWDGLTPTRFGLDLGYSRVLRMAEEEPLRLAAGIRTAVPVAGATIPLELYAKAALEFRVGAWNPSIGLELGLSGFAIPPRPAWARERSASVSSSMGPAYIALDVSPLQFRFAHLRLSLLDLQYGPTLWPFGETARLQLGLVRVGVVP